MFAFSLLTDPPLITLIFHYSTVRRELLSNIIKKIKCGNEACVQNIINCLENIILLDKKMWTILTMYSSRYCKMNSKSKNVQNSSFFGNFPSSSLYQTALVLYFTLSMTVPYCLLQCSCSTPRCLSLTSRDCFTVHYPNKNPRKNAIENVRLLYIYRISGP